MDTMEIIKNYLGNNLTYEEQNIDYNLDLVHVGIIDSVTLVKVILFLEKEFHIKLAESDLLPNNFDTIASMAQLVERKLMSK